MSHLAISLLGPFQVTRDGEPVTGFDSDTARALLAYLVLRAETPCPREMLAGLFWPEWPNSEALRNLRVALSRLRDAIGDRETEPPYLHITRKTLQFNVESDHWLDVSVFSDAVAASKSHEHRQLERCASCMAKLEEAASLYRGDFLAGFSLDSAPFEEWLVVQRESLHLQALEVLHHLALYHERQGEYDQALRYARRQVELEPWREGAHRQCMRALSASGQRGMAMAQYEACRQVLVDELGVETEAETAALYEQIRTGALTPRARLPVEWAAAEPRVETPPPPTAVPAPEKAPIRSPPPLGQAVPEGERRVVTVVQAEVSGSAALASRVDGEEWAAFVGQFLRAAGAEVQRLGGEVDRYDPEGLVALFGARAAHEDDPERAVLAALAMQTLFQAQLAQRAQLAEVEPGWEAPEAPGLRVGVHTGEAIVTPVEGESGSGRRALMGDALSSAYRVLALASLGEVQVSEMTRSFLENAPAHREIVALWVETAHPWPSATHE
jgi:DNA-binding SARP family transcriptional activator/class 3 adenylate cyclase